MRYGVFVAIRLELAEHLNEEVALMRRYILLLFSAAAVIALLMVGNIGVVLAQQPEVVACPKGNGTQVIFEGKAKTGGHCTPEKIPTGPK